MLKADAGKLPRLNQSIHIDVRDRRICVSIDKTELTFNWFCSARSTRLSQCNDEERIMSCFGWMQSFVPLSILKSVMQLPLNRIRKS